MDQTINSKLQTSPMQFYDSLADDYDEMTGLEDRFEKERQYFRTIVERYNLKTALDAGCGTGFHSILLAQLGLQVTATDISEQMLHKTILNAERKGVRIDTLQISFQNISESIQNTYDAVFCLGNSLPHLITEKELIETFKSFRSVLNNNGRLFLQLLNYDKILTNRERIQNIKEVNGKIFIRFYDYEADIITFNILTIKKDGKKFEHSLKSVKLFPWRTNNILRNLQYTGYDQINFFGNMSLCAFDENSSKDLVVIAQKI